MQKNMIEQEQQEQQDEQKYNLDMSIDKSSGKLIDWSLVRLTFCKLVN